ncbi:Hypothetical protein PHPALM_36238 [Phytophthora palmivora]|uniref:Transmembrane protein n=1 Tax=Phytophthora palmivora TaxID=4796 RepID=A0A2P4X0F6_9STRA|nr:Hypothetical protein PHPALM_36238 [Phytophthora palmivora]
MTNWSRKLVKTWEATQVELNGNYSSKRVRDLAQYTRETSSLHVLAVILLTPIPCLLTTVVIDVLPLANPSQGVNANKVFWIREYYTFLVVTFLATEQFRYSVPILPYPLMRAIINSFIAAALSVTLMYGLALAIGFPLPFSILLVTPPWLSFITMFLAIEWGKKIRETPGSGTMLINVIKLWLCQVLMVFIYPPYYFIFTTLSPKGQTAFSMLLPVIKVAMRNVFGRTVVHMSDEVPEVITFNIEIYNALFISYCMQNSPSIGTTLMVTVTLLVQLAMSLRDVYEATQRMELVGRRLGGAHQYGEPQYSKLKPSAGGRKLSALLHAETMLLSDDSHIRIKVRSMSSVRVRSERLSSCHDENVLVESGEPSDTISVEERDFKFESRSTVQLQHSVEVRIPESVKLAKSNSVSKQLSPTLLQYVLEVRRLMYLTEFLVLINYVGVFIPLIFSIYMVVMYHLPNRMYYAQLANLSKDDLYEALKNVMFNCSLKLVALIILCSVLQYKLHFSALRQLAFVLEKQWFSVQTKAVFWVYYNVQCSLQHQGTTTYFILFVKNVNTKDCCYCSGYDYSFHFAWLQSSESNNSTMT